MLLESLERIFPFFQFTNKSLTEEIHQKEFQSISLTYIFLLAISLIISGIIFFFAYNWQAIPNLVKLGAIQVLFAISGIGAYKIGLDSIFGKIALTFTSILVGVFLAVFGQVYQTGADSYQLFVTWSLAILPIVLISKFSFQWILFTFLLNISIYLTWNSLYKSDDYTMLYILLSLLNASLLFAREIFRDKFDWIENKFTRLILFCLLQFSLSGFILAQVSNSNSIFYEGVAFIISIGLYFIYRYKVKDLLILTTSVLSLATTLFIYIVGQISFDIDSIMPLAIFTILALGGTAHYIGVLQKEFSEKKATSEDIHHSDVVKNNQTNKKFLNKNILRPVTCVISAAITVIALIALLLVFFSEIDPVDSYILTIIGVISLFASLGLYKLYREESINFESNSFTLLYISLTSLILAYTLISADLLLLEEIPIFQVAIIFTVVSLVVYPFIYDNTSRSIIILYTAALILGSIYENSMHLLIFSMLILILMTCTYLLGNIYTSLQAISRTFFIGFSSKIILMLSDTRAWIFSAEYLYQFSILLALWTFILYVLYTKKINAFRRNFSGSSLIIHPLALACLVFFTYYSAYPIIYLIGLLILSLYIEKISLLRNTIYLSIPVLFYYYYNLDITLLYKSYTLFLSGAILLLFCGYNKEGLTDAK